MEEDDIAATRRREEAARWFARLKTLPVTHGTLNAFFTWRRERGNAEAFEEAERFWSAAGKVGERPEILRAVEAAAGRKARRRGSGVAVRPAFWLAASVFLLISVYAGYALLVPGERAFATDTGERRTVALDDGSRLELNSATHVSVHYSRTGRDLELERGQALFNVARDRTRPFTVRTGGAIVTATGTQFDIANRGEQILVTLLEGSVTVRAPDGEVRALRTGEQWRWPANGLPVRKVKADDVAAWTHGWVVFDDTPLVDAIAEVNRQGGQRIRLDAAHMGHQRISGSFQAGDSESFAAAVTAFLPLRRRSDSEGQIRLEDPTQQE